jgi:predicted permease
MALPLRVCLALYRRVARAYPQEFRMQYGEDLERLGEDAAPEAWRRYGLRGLVGLVADIAMQLPATYLNEIRQDVLYALRVLAKSPGFASIVVVSLAVGIGMCCAVFSESESMGGPPPGIRDPAALYTLRAGASYPYFERYREQHRVLESATAIITQVPFAVAFAWGKNARVERFYGHLVSPEYFSTLGVTPAAGRFFSAQTERPGMPPVVVISERFWRTHMGSAADAVGRRLRLNGAMATIVGIGPKDFLGLWPGNPADLFVPVTCGALAPELNDHAIGRRDREIFRVVFRLAHGVPVARAEAALEAVTRNFDREIGVRERMGRVARAMPAGTVMLMSPEQHAFIEVFNWVLWALVLSLVCANLANLLLARGTQRRKEIAIRLSVGASRGRLVRQFLTESMLLSFTGGIGGILLAYLITHAISSLPLPTAGAFEFKCEPDSRVLVITLAIALAAGIGFGLLPALASARTDVNSTLKEGALAPLRGYRRFGLRNLFVVCQMAASLMLLLVTWYVALNFLVTARVDPGFDLANLNLLSIDPVRDGYSAEQAASLAAALPDELSRVSGVRSVALADSVPFASLAADSPNTQVMAATRYGEALHAVFKDRVGADYFATLGTPLVSGREFDRRDSSEGAIPAILNQTAVRELFGADFSGNEGAIGRRIREGDETYVVVGVTRDVQSGFLRTTPVATVFLPFTADLLRKKPMQRITVLLRGDALGAVRERMASLHPGLTVFNVRTLRETMDQMNSFIDLDSAIYVILAVFAMALASIGLGGVTAYAVAQRRKEIGIRMALGARSRQVRALVMREGLALVIAGSAAGFGGALAIAHVFSAYSDVLARSFGTRENSPLLSVGVPILLAGMAMVACYLPARRATRIEPISALREE